jgi:hypothetical protein
MLSQNKLTRLSILIFFCIVLYLRTNGITYFSAASMTNKKIMRNATRLVIVELDDRDVSTKWVIGGGVWGQSYKSFYGRNL